MSGVAVLGAGSWGTALAIHLVRAGRDVRLWARDAELADEIRANGRNTRYLSDQEVPDAVVTTAALDEAVDGAEFVVFAVPSHGLRVVVANAAPFIASGAVLVSATKGLELETLQRMSEVVREETAGTRPIVALSGPSFAVEVARGLPTAVIAASSDERAAAAVQEQFRSRGFRIYASDDVAGVEIGGALKNVIAIAAGCVEGLGLGHNAMAALITRGLTEISRLATAEGAKRETLAGLSGLGDLVLTCTGDLSRNRHVGVELGRGRTLDAILSGMRMVAEGVRTTVAAVALGEQHGVELPITVQMAAVLDARVSPMVAVESLMGRKQRAEADS